MDSMAQIGIEQNRLEEQRRQEAEQYLLKIGRELDSPLTEVTRKERRSLMVASAVGLFVNYTGLVPSKIESLGITFEAKEQRLISVSIGVVVLYLAISFLIPALFEIVQFRRHQKQARRTYSLKTADRVESIKRLKDAQGAMFVPKIGREYIEFLEDSLGCSLHLTSGDEILRRFNEKEASDEPFKKEYAKLKKRLEFAADQWVLEVARRDNRHFDNAYWLNWARAFVEVGLPMGIAIWSMLVLF